MNLLRKVNGSLLLALLFFNLNAGDPQAEDLKIEGELKQWHRVTLMLKGPEVTEEPATFRNYRLNVTFRKGTRKYVIPGHFAADGDAANTSASAGNLWRVYFTPSEPGEWQYRISFKTGPDLALSTEETDGQAVLPLHGKTGSLYIDRSDKKSTDFRAKGLLRYVGEHYQQFEGDHSYWLGIGTGSPESILGGSDFDATRIGMKEQWFSDHIQDWKAGDPTWGDGRGKGVIGALNYAISTGMNTLWVSLMNAFCDSNDCYPWPTKEKTVSNLSTFDVSKLDQWHVLMEHGQNNGMAIHAILGEEESEGLWEKVEGLPVGGDCSFAITRKLYYREIVSRFGHFNALDWNMGEEFGHDNGITNTAPFGGWPPISDAQKILFTNYLASLDAYNHSRGWEGDPNVPMWDYAPWFARTEFNRAAIQGATPQANEYSVTLRLASKAAGRPWVINFSEHHGPELELSALTEDHYPIFRNSVWGTFLGGGAGMEWYLKYDDYFLVSYRPYKQVLIWTRYVHDFMYDYLPFWEMEPDNTLARISNGYCLAKRGEIYAIYNDHAENVHLNLGIVSGSYEVFWFDPRDGGELQSGTVRMVEGGSVVSLGQPPYEVNEDWVTLIRRIH